MKKTVTLNEDEAKLLAICFSNYSIAIKAYDNGEALSGDDVIVSGLALLAAQRVIGIELAKPSVVERFIAEVRNEDMEE